MKTFKQFLTESESSVQAEKFLEKLFYKKVFSKENYDSDDPIFGQDTKNVYDTYDGWSITLYQAFVDIRRIERDDSLLSMKLLSTSRNNKEILEALLGISFKDMKFYAGENFDLEKAFDKLLKPIGWEYVGINNNGWYLLAKIGEGKPVLDLPKKIYHFSAMYNKDKILKKGLIPKSVKDRDKFRYSHRIFCLEDYDLDDIKELAFYIHNYDTSAEDMYDGHDKSEPIVVFEIDTSKLRKGTKFYEDVGHPGAVWTKTHIPPEAISVKYEDEVPKDYYDRR